MSLFVYFHHIFYPLTNTRICAAPTCSLISCSLLSVLFRDLGEEAKNLVDRVMDVVLPALRIQSSQFLHAAFTSLAFIFKYMVKHLARDIPRLFRCVQLCPVVLRSCLHVPFLMRTGAIIVSSWDIANTMFEDSPQKVLHIFSARSTEDIWCRHIT